MNLKRLAKETEYSPEQQRYYLAHIEEIGADYFVEELCRIAYYDGVYDEKAGLIEED